MMGILSGLLPLAILAGLIWAAITAVRSVTEGGDSGRPTVDTAEAVKSAAIHVGLFLALIACVLGSIDLLQSLVGESEQLAGSNSDVARGLSLLIVGAPAFGLVLRSIDRRYRQRAANGDAQPHRGWSVYLVAALTTTLVATLVSTAQVAHSLTDEFDKFDPNELMQLFVWLATWLIHWFGLRPRYRVLGDVHLAIGSIVGLAWMLSGAGATTYRLLAAGYDATFNDSIVRSINTEYWVAFGLTGLGVWVWHWVAHLNTRGSADSVEGTRRGSPLWFFTVVVAGVLPGLIAIIFTSTTMISGLMIWFVGSTDKEAAQYFEPAPWLTAALFTGVLTWAYHRWELERDGAPERNESLRFHDYIVVSVGLLGVVGSVAALVGLAVGTVSVDRYFAGTNATTNTLIIALTVLVASASVWWWHWRRIEGHRGANPAEESDSIWRKLYLIAGFGGAGLVLSVSLIWLLFAFLRDLIDGQLGHGTLDDLKGPLGWALAVVGAVWFHLGVWRVDRATIDEVINATVTPQDAPMPASQPPPPAAIDPNARLLIRTATRDDYGEIFTLQRAAYAEEPIDPQTANVPALIETFDEAQLRLDKSTTTVAVDGFRIIGAVSVRTRNDHHPEIDRLMIAPDQSGLGVDSLLLAEVERRLPTLGES